MCRAVATCAVVPMPSLGRKLRLAWSSTWSQVSQKPRQPDYEKSYSLHSQSYLKFHWQVQCCQHRHLLAWIQLEMWPNESTKHKCDGRISRCAFPPTPKFVFPSHWLGAHTYNRSEPQILSKEIFQVLCVVTLQFKVGFLLEFSIPDRSRQLLNAEIIVIIISLICQCWWVDNALESYNLNLLTLLLQFLHKYAVAFLREMTLGWVYEIFISSQ